MCWEAWRYPDYHQLQHHFGSGVAEQILQLSLFFLTSGVAGHCQANSAYDDVHKSCAKVINVLQQRLEI